MELALTGKSLAKAGRQAGWAAPYSRRIERCGGGAVIRYWSADWCLREAWTHTAPMSESVHMPAEAFYDGLIRQHAIFIRHSWIEGLFTGLDGGVCRHAALCREERTGCGGRDYRASSSGGSRRCRCLVCYRRSGRKTLCQGWMLSKRPSKLYQQRGSYNHENIKARNRGAYI